MAPAPDRSAAWAAMKGTEKPNEKPADASDPFNSDTKPAEKPAAKEAGKAAEPCAAVEPCADHGRFSLGRGELSVAPTP